MRVASKISEAERGAIVTFLRGGKSQGWTARKVGRSKDTVRRIAAGVGIESSERIPKKAAAARKAYAEERRLEILGKGFDVSETLLKGIADAAEFQRWSVGFGTLVDKARLETGKATSREERVNGDARDKQFHGLFSELNAYRTEFNDGNREGASDESIHSSSADSEAT